MTRGITVKPSTRSTDDQIAEANTLTAGFAATISPSIEIYDNTLREGEQTPGVALDAAAKLDIAQALDELGVHWANVGFPVVSAAERKAVEAVASRGLRMRLSALCRLRAEDIALTADTGVQMIALFIGTSDSHLRDKLGMDEDTALREVERSVAAAKARGVVVSLALEDGSRTPFERIVRFADVGRNAGADVLVFPDTVGILTPSATFRIVSALRERIRLPLSLHFHNDLGLALANSLAGLEAGADVVQVTVNGLGERTGNTKLEELAVALRVKYGVDCGIDLGKLVGVCQLVSRRCNVPLSPADPITGRWAFMHESGIHQAGILANPCTYQPYPPALIGRGHELVFGKHTGGKAISYLAEVHGIALSRERVAELLERVKVESERTGELVDFETVVGWMRAGAPR